MEGIIRKLHNIEVLDVPVGLALGFTLSVSVVKILKNLSARIPAIGNLIQKMPIAVGFGLAYLVQMPYVKKLVGKEGANMISVASMFMGIEEQIRVMKGQTLSDFIASLPQRIGGGTTAISSPYIPMSLPAGEIGKPALEIGVSTPYATNDIARALRLNMS